MKRLFTLLFLLLSVIIFSQETIQEVLSKYNNEKIPYMQPYRTSVLRPESSYILDAREYKHLNLLTGSLSIKLHSIAYKCLSSIPISFHFLLVKLFAKKDMNSYKFTKEIDEKDGVNRALDIYEDVNHDK